MKDWPEGLYSIPAGLARCHLLADGEGLALIDAGLWPRAQAVLDYLALLGRDVRELKAILLTHGHLDHTGGLQRLRKLSGAPVYAHVFENAQVQGKGRPRRWNRLCGLLERAGRIATGFRAGQVDVFIEDGELIDVWGGLRVVYLPGHTRGHCGFFSRKHNLLFTGDLFAMNRLGRGAHLSPWFLNSDGDLFGEAFARVWEIDPAGLVPNHFRGGTPGAFREAFDRLYTRKYKGWRKRPPEHVSGTVVSELPKKGAR